MSILDEEGQRTVQMRFLDLSGMHITTKEELQNVMIKMLEVRLRPDKLTEDEISRIIYCESSSPSAEYPFLDPIPASMKDVNLTELSQVDIDWKMLTLARPNTKQEMEIFTRFVELEKLKLKSLIEEDEKAEARVTAIKVKVEADGFEQESNSDEFTYDYFSRRLAVEEMPPSEDSSKKAPETEKRKLSEKLDSVTRQETFPEPADSPSPIPEVEPEAKRKLSAKKRKKKKKAKRLRKKKIPRKKRKRRIKRLKNGRVVFVTIKRKKKWYTLKKEKRKSITLKASAVSREQTGNGINPAQSEITTGEEMVEKGSISNETEGSKDISSAKSSVIKESSPRLRRIRRDKKTTKVPKAKKVSDTAEKAIKTGKDNLVNDLKTDVGAPKSATAGRHINTPKHVKRTSSRILAKRGIFARTTSIRRTKTVKVAKMKITQAARARKESTSAKLDADGKEIESDEIEKEEEGEEEGRVAEKNVSSAKLSSSARGNTKMNVKNRRSLKPLIKANIDPKGTPESSPENPSEDSKESNKESDAFT